MQVGQDAGDRDGMGDVGLAGEAFLAFVGLSAEFVGADNLGDLVGREIGLQPAQKLGEANRPLPLRQAAKYGSGIDHN